MLEVSQFNISFTKEETPVQTQLDNRSATERQCQAQSPELGSLSKILFFCITAASPQP